MLHNAPPISRRLPVVVAVLMLAFASASRVEAQDARRFAIIVGVEQYDHSKLPPLEFAEEDADELSSLLRTVNYDVTLLTGSVGQKDPKRAPTKENIETAIKQVVDQTNRNDTIIVALMGHGLQFTGKVDSFFCPRDARPLSDRLDTLVSLNTIYKQLDDSGAGIKVLLVDACRNDPDPGRGRGVDADTAPNPPRGVAVLFSCSSGERAYEHKKLKHGIFTHFVLEGLRGEARDSDGEVTFENLAGYVKKQTARTVPELLGPGRQQSPTLRATLSGVPPVLLSKLDLARLKSGVSTSTTEKNSLGMELALVPAGEFLMGSEDSADDLMRMFTYARREWLVSSEPRHRVQISRPFFLSTTEVTVGQFRKFVEATNYRTDAERDGQGGGGYDPVLRRGVSRRAEFTWRNPGFAQQDDHPVVNVSWNDARAFCVWLSGIEGKTYRLPTEAEWEYACRGKTASRYSHGDEPEGLVKVANSWDSGATAKFDNITNQISGDDGHVFTAPAAAYRANAFGLFDMHGNAWEWCNDVFDERYYGVSPQTDPLGPVNGDARVYRGGGWISSACFCRSAGRMKQSPDYRTNSVGFRVAVTK